MLLRSSRRTRPLPLGYLFTSLLEAVKRLQPDFEPTERRKLEPSVLAPELKTKPFLPTWRRRRDDGGEAGQSLVEYALVLALIAIVAIVALVFIGEQASRVLQSIGESI
jgi:Flp pilus assembly pilin Flp